MASAASAPDAASLTGLLPPPSLALRVVGNHLVNGLGLPITLRGVNVSGTEFACAQGWTDDAYGGAPLASAATYQAIKGWQANFVRIPLNEDCWLGINGVRVGGAAYQQAIATEVAAAQAEGLYVVIDLHWTAPGTQTALSQNPLPDADHSPLFWKQVATAYKSTPGVIFDLFNEPFDYWGTSGDPWSEWLSGGVQTQYITGGSPYTVAANWSSAGMQQLLDAVRSAGAQQPVLVNGLDWANDLSGWLAHVPNDPAHQLIAGAHFYPGQPRSTTESWDSVVAPIAAKYPILVGETGDHATAPVSSFLPTILGYAKSHGWSLSAWTWNPWTAPDDVLITDWSGTPNSGEGTTYKAWLAGFVGP